MVMLVTLQIISIISLHYTYFSYRQTEAERLIYANGAASFSVGFRGGEKLGEVNSKVKNLAAENGNDIECIYMVLDESNALRAYVFGQHYIVHLGENFTSSKDVVMSSGNAAKEGYSIGDTVILMEREYKVSGLRDSSYDEIPYSSLLPADVVYSVVFTLSKLPTTAETDGFAAQLSAAFGDDVLITKPDARDFKIEYGINAEQMISVLLICLSLLNIAFIFKYSVQKRKTLYTVSRICGAKTIKLFLILFAEATIYFIISVVFGTFIFRYAVMPSTVTKYIFGYEDFIPSIVVFLSASIIAFVSPIITFLRSTPIEIKQR